MKRVFENPKSVRVLYLGTPEIAVLPLERLLTAGFSVVGVVSQEDKRAGRNGSKLEVPAVKKAALAHSLPVFQPHRIREDYSFAKALSFDVIVCMAYGQIVPTGFLNLAPCGAINLHASLLPHLRGAAPIQRAILEGEKESGVSLMEMVAAMDAGEVYDQTHVCIEESDTTTSLSQKMSLSAAEMIVRDLLPYVNGTLKGVPQDESKVTFAKKILPEDEHLPLGMSCSATNRYIRALAELPGAYLFVEGKKLKIFSASFSSEAKTEVGTLLPTKSGLYLGCADGTLKLEEVQYEGKKRMDAKSFLNGAHWNGIRKFVH